MFDYRYVVTVSFAWIELGKLIVSVFVFDRSRFLHF